jgi:hypothetical protein
MRAEKILAFLVTSAVLAFSLKADDDPQVTGGGTGGPTAKLRPGTSPKYILVDLRAVVGGTGSWSSANGVNNAGVVVGSVDGNQAFRFPPQTSGGSVWLGTGTNARDINNPGVIVGSWLDDETPKAVYWQNGTKHVLPGDVGGEAERINDGGKVLAGTIYWPSLTSAFQKFSSVEAEGENYYIPYPYWADEGGYWVNGGYHEVYRGISRPINAWAGGINNTGKMAGCYGMLTGIIYEPFSYVGENHGMETMQVPAEAGPPLKGGAAVYTATDTYEVKGDNLGCFYSINEAGLSVGGRNVEGEELTPIVSTGSGIRLIGPGIALVVNNAESPQVAGSTYTTGILWQKNPETGDYVRYDLNQLISPDPTRRIRWINDMNDQGMMVGMARTVRTSQGQPIPEEDQVDQAVALVPVDLDVVHPATGEESESRESSEGGYVAIRRDANTPVTKLRLHKFAMAGAQFKLSWTSDKILIWKDAAGTEAVASDDTTFSADVDRDVFLEGVAKSDTIKDVEVELKVIVGSTEYPPVKIKLTVVQAEFPITVRAFIPYLWTQPDTSFTYTIAAEGDNRGLSLTEQAGFRIRQKITITPYQDLHSGTDIASEQLVDVAPLSNHYDKNTAVPVSERGGVHGYSLIPGIPPENSGPPSVTTSKTKFDFKSRANPKSVKYDIAAGGEDGAMPWYIPSFAVPDIDWHFDVEVDCTNPVNPKITAIGERDGFPGYEILALTSDKTLKEVYYWIPPVNRQVGIGPLTTPEGVNATLDVP